MKKIIICIVLFLSLNIRVNASNNEVINLDYFNDELIASRKELDSIKGNNETLTYNVFNNGEIIYSFIFNGNYYKDSYNSIDLKINEVNISNDILEKFNDKKLIKFKTNYEGYYPEGTILKIRNNNNFNINKKLYLTNFKNNNLQNTKEVYIENDFINIDINNGSTYILSYNKIVSSNTLILFYIILSILIIEVLIIMFITIRNNKKQIAKKQTSSIKYTKKINIK
ncbi:MAG: hypothetical protein IJD92_03650 [Bacilli bacterium]|nr:hypothetical protein [Bacilli bacterium]